MKTLQQKTQNALRMMRYDDDDDDDDDDERVRQHAHLMSVLNILDGFSSDMYGSASMPSR